MADSTADRIEREVAAAIHSNHSALPALSPPCFLCRRDARAVLRHLRDIGFSVTATPSPTPAPINVLLS